MSPLILFAHPAEAQPTLERLQAQPISTALFESEEATIAVCGVGALAAAVSAALHGSASAVIWNIGLCGALDATLEEGAICEVSLVSRYLPMPEEVAAQSRRFAEEAHPPIRVGLGDYRLISCDYGIQTAPVRAQLARDHHLVDMEGYGVARAALACNKKCRLWKIVSDHADGRTPTLIRERLPFLANRLADHLVRELRHFSAAPTSDENRCTPAASGPVSREP
jgi:nucleoside phosphorylase